MQDLRQIPYMGLSKQEYVIAELLTRGKTEKEIAGELFIAPKTVNNHKTNIRKKWGARNAVDIARKFILSLDDPKKFFVTIIFLMIQGNVLFTGIDVELRRAAKAKAKTTKIVRTTSRRI